MAKVVSRLSESIIKNLLPKENDYRKYDGEGLCLLVRKSGTKVWQYPYKFNGKNTICTIGHYKKDKDFSGHVSLKEARFKRHEIRILLDQGIDPNKHKLSLNENSSSQPNFEQIAREWHSKGVWTSKKHSKNIMRTLENDVFTIIGAKSIDTILPADVIKVLENIEARGALDVAKRVCQRCEAIFDYAIAKGLCQTNPAYGRSRFIKKRKVKHRPGLSENQLPEFVKRLDAYHGHEYIKLGVWLLMLTFLRPGEVINSKWENVNFEKNKYLQR